MKKNIIDYFWFSERSSILLKLVSSERLGRKGLADWAIQRENKNFSKLKIQFKQKRYEIICNMCSTLKSILYKY